MAKVNILKQIHRQGRWRLVSIPRTKGKTQVGSTPGREIFCRVVRGGEAPETGRRNHPLRGPGGSPAQESGRHSSISCRPSLPRQGPMTTKSQLQSRNDIVDRVTAHYLGSHDFNGFPVRELLTDFNGDTAALKNALSGLIKRGQLSLNFGDIHPNPHIKAFPEEPKDVQLEKLQKANLTHVYAYPSRSHLKRLVKPAKYKGRPFTLRLALGEPQLAFQAFDLTVLELYKNDPRYYYRCDDISGKISVHSKHYRKIRRADSVLLESFGFAYNKKLRRAVAVFLRYLTGLSPEHQQIWQAKALRGKYQLHPDYLRPSLGHWPERIALFDAFIEEMHNVNEMCRLIGWPPLFVKEFDRYNKPRGFGFLIRPTAKEFYEFAHLLDKMLSENINKDFFRGELQLIEETAREDGKVEVRQKGTVQLLDEWISKKFSTPDRKPIEDMVSALKLVRKLRQRPAHALDDDRFDQKFFERQRDLMIKAYEALRTLRLMFANHPRARGCKISEELEKGLIWTY